MTDEQKHADNKNEIYGNNIKSDLLGQHGLNFNGINLRDDGGLASVKSYNAVTFKQWCHEIGEDGEEEDASIVLYEPAEARGKKLSNAGEKTTKRYFKTPLTSKIQAVYETDSRAQKKLVTVVAKMSYKERLEGLKLGLFRPDVFPASETLQMMAYVGQHQRKDFFAREKETHHNFNPNSAREANKAADDIIFDILLPLVEIEKLSNNYDENPEDLLDGLLRSEDLTSVQFHQAVAQGNLSRLLNKVAKACQSINKLLEDSEDNDRKQHLLRALGKLKPGISYDDEWLNKRLEKMLNEYDQYVEKLLRLSLTNNKKKERLSEAVKNEGFNLDEYLFLDDADIQEDVVREAFSNYNKGRSISIKQSLHKDIKQHIIDLYQAFDNKTSLPYQRDNRARGLISLNRKNEKNRAYHDQSKAAFLDEGDQTVDLAEFTIFGSEQSEYGLRKTDILFAEAQKRANGQQQEDSLDDAARSVITKMGSFINKIIHKIWSAIYLVMSFIAKVVFWAFSDFLGFFLIYGICYFLKHNRMPSEWFHDKLESYKPDNKMLASINKGSNLVDELNRQAIKVETNTIVGQGI